MDGPIRMQLTHDVRIRSVSAPGLYDPPVSRGPRSHARVADELGADHIDLLKLDIEGSEYDIVPTLGLQALDVLVFATQLRHIGSIRSARSLIELVRAQGYEPVAVRPVLKITCLRSDQLVTAISAVSCPGANGSPRTTR